MRYYAKAVLNERFNKLFGLLEDNHLYKKQCKAKMDELQEAIDLVDDLNVKRGNKLTRKEAIYGIIRYLQGEINGEQLSDSNVEDLIQIQMKHG